MAVKAVPERYHTVTPHLVCRNGKKAIEFYQKAFGAKDARAHYMSDGRLMHAELQIGDSVIMLGEEFPEFGVRSPEALGGTPVVLHIYVPDVDSVFQRAVSAGCTVSQPLMDQFWGDRYGQVVDPFGHKWSLATHKEDVSPEEMEKRGRIAMEQMQAQHK